MCSVHFGKTVCNSHTNVNFLQDETKHTFSEIFFTFSMFLKTIEKVKIIFKKKF